MNPSQDDTERCRRLEERLRVLSEAMCVFAEATTDWQTLLDTVARRIAEVIKDYCIVQLLSDDGQTLTPVAAFDPDPEALRGLRDALSEPFLLDAHPVARRVLESGEAFFAPIFDIERLRPPQTTARYFAFVQRIAIHSVLIVPLRVHDRSVGQMILARFRGDSPPFDEQDLDLAQNLASHAALAISNARLLAEARRESSERKRVTDRLGILAEASREFSVATYDYHRLLQVVASRLGELLGDMCAIRAITEDGEWLESAGAAYHRDPELLAVTREVMLSSRQRVGDGVSGRVAATGVPLLAPKVDTAADIAASDPRYRPLLDRLGG
jgi:GAF domain-containing protein